MDRRRNPVVLESVVQGVGNVQPLRCHVMEGDGKGAGIDGHDPGEPLVLLELVEQTDPYVTRRSGNGYDRPVTNHWTGRP